MPAPRIRWARSSRWRSRFLKTGPSPFITRPRLQRIWLRKAAGIDKGSGEPNRRKVAQITRTRCGNDRDGELQTNANDVEGAMRIIEGTARSMGIGSWRRWVWPPCRGRPPPRLPPLG